MDPRSVFGERLRLRVSGLLVEDDAILLVRIHSPVTDQKVWMPPGGGVQFGEPMAEALQREFREETQVDIEVHGLLHVEEFIKEPFHAVECYFEVSRKRGEASRGHDPELGNEEQLIEEVSWMEIEILESRSFSPDPLLSKLKNWENRSSFTVF
ncbi:NUDIX domain-containing protein [Fodinibius sediminis]|uniref:8-oxo-dGTP diphosphatase n=1 Tax=Fodinibius sediminis TaxID=1214077 RepID=A0A521E0G3_9BACT|nr:NUDIX domain-containing protein [Fodinibius sediminis]SMO77444.1 8-oxo-dGTP diphosphatase [Fodinibius sediminis]